ncbi:MAG: TY-Chap domain-containing protein [Microbacteriaceae bacterium]
MGTTPRTEPESEPAASQRSFHGIPSKYWDMSKDEQRAVVGEIVDAFREQVGKPRSKPTVEPEPAAPEHPVFVIPPEPEPIVPVVHMKQLSEAELIERYWPDGHAALHGQFGLCKIFESDWQYHPILRHLRTWPGHQAEWVLPATTNERLTELRQETIRRIQICWPIDPDDDEPIAVFHYRAINVHWFFMPGDSDVLPLGSTMSQMPGRYVRLAHDASEAPFGYVHTRLSPWKREGIRGARKVIRSEWVDGIWVPIPLERWLDLCERYYVSEMDEKHPDPEFEIARRAKPLWRYHLDEYADSQKLHEWYPWTPYAEHRSAKDLLLLHDYLNVIPVRSGRAASHVMFNYIGWSTTDLMDVLYTALRATPENLREQLHQVKRVHFTNAEHWAVEWRDRSVTRSSDPVPEPDPVEPEPVIEPEPVEPEAVEHEPEVDLQHILEAAMVRLLNETDHWTLQLDRPESACPPYAQAIREVEGWTVEISGDQFVDPPMSAAKVDRLRFIGFRLPDASLPNFHQLVVTAEEGAFILSRALIEVFGMTVDEEFRVGTSKGYPEDILNDYLEMTQERLRLVRDSDARDSGADVGTSM